MQTDGGASLAANTTIACNNAVSNVKAKLDEVFMLISEV